MRKWLFRSFLIATLACTSQPGATAGAKPQQTAPDNSGVNKRDRSAQELTADQQKENASDRAISQKIRQAVVGDKSLSTYAHNVKIITQNGEVTLKGPVNTIEEKQKIEAKANNVAGQGHVVDEIDVVPAKTK